MRLTAIVILLASSTAALAEPRHHAVSVQLATLDTTGVAILGEHDLQWKKLSAVVALGGRSAAHGDYGSFSVGVGVELRRWLLRPTAMRGWYVAARTDLARTTLEDMVDSRSIGALTTWSIGAATGYRFVIKNRIEITPSIGAATVVEGGMDGMSPTTVRGAATVGVTAGVLF